MRSTRTPNRSNRTDDSIESASHAAIRRGEAGAVRRALGQSRSMRTELRAGESGETDGETVERPEGGIGPGRGNRGLLGERAGGAQSERGDEAAAEGPRRSSADEEGAGRQRAALLSGRRCRIVALRQDHYRTDPAMVRRHDAG